MIVWDLDAAEAGTDPIKYRFNAHKVKVQGLSFSPSGAMLATLGGSDDNKLALWRLDTGRMIMTTEAGNDSALCVTFASQDDSTLVTGGYYTLRKWSMDPVSKKWNFAECHIGKLQRVIMSVAISEDDTFLYAGSATGDVFKIRLITTTGVPIFVSASRPPLFEMGVHEVKCAGRHVYVGTGSGTLAKLDSKSFKTLEKIQLSGSVTSLALNDDDRDPCFFVGTSTSQIYKVSPGDGKKIPMKEELLSTCHPGIINDVCFHAKFSKVFLTCSKGDIRVWDRAQKTELLRIQVS